MTLQDLINQGFPLDKHFILQDPDTWWLLTPTFRFDEEHIVISADYNDRRRDLEEK